MATATATTTPLRAAVKWRLMWRDSLLAWTGLHLVGLGVSLLVARFSGRNWITPWISYFDSVSFAAIASHGYQTLLLTAFYPLYPITERVVSPLTDGNTLIAGTLVSNVACLGAFVLIRVWAERAYGQAIAWRVLAYLASAPMALYLLTSYSEALFLLLSVAVFVAVQRCAWLAAGALAALATLCRPVGILLVMVIAARAWYTHNRLNWRVLVALALAPIALLAFMVFLWRQTGIWNAPSVAEWIYFRRGFTWPWTGVEQAIWALQHAPNSLLALGVAADLASVVCAVALTFALARRWPDMAERAAILYTAASVLFVLLVPYQMGHVWYHPPHGLSNTNALTVAPRYFSVVFPLAVPLARLGTRSRWIHYIILALNMIALTWAVAQFAQFQLIE